MTLLRGSITQSGDNGRLGLDFWCTEFAHPSNLPWLHRYPTLSISSAAFPDVLSFLRSVQVLGAFVLCQPPLFFVHWWAVALAVADVIRFFFDDEFPFLSALFNHVFFIHHAFKLHPLNFPMSWPAVFSNTEFSSAPIGSRILRRIFNSFSLRISIYVVVNLCLIWIVFAARCGFQYGYLVPTILAVPVLLDQV